MLLLDTSNLSDDGLLHLLPAELHWLDIPQ